MSNPYNNLETFNNDIIKKKYKINRKNTEFPENEKKVDRFAKTAHFGKSFIGLNELMNNFPKGNNIDSLIAMNEISKGEPVYLNVYHINILNYFLQFFGCGIYHSTIYVFDNEYSFGCSNNKSISGIYKANNQTKKFLFKAIFLGFTLIQQNNLDILINLLSIYWQTGNYNAFDKNCNHFTYFFSRLLIGESSYPSYINQFTKNYHLFDPLFNNISKIMRDMPNSINIVPNNIVPDIVNPNSTTNNINNTNNGQIMTNNDILLKNTIYANNLDHSNDFIKLKCSSNLILSIKKELVNDEIRREFKEIKTKFKVLLKLFIINDEMCSCLIECLERHLNNKDSLTLNNLTEITNLLKKAYGISLKHFTKEFEKCILLNKVIDETLLFVKKLIDIIKEQYIKEFISKEHNEIKLLLNSLNLKIYEKVPDHNAFVLHCNKIFREIKEVYDQKKQNLNFSLTNVKRNTEDLDNI